MTLLGRTAALATIVAALFTVATYFKGSDERVEADTPSASASLRESQTGNIARKSNGRTPSTSTEMNHDVREAEIKIRFVAARKIPGLSSKSDALQELAKKASDLGFPDTAFVIALEIPSISTKSATLSYVAKEAAKSGSVKLAIRIAEKIPSLTTKSQTLREISKM